MNNEYLMSYDDADGNKVECSDKYLNCAVKFLGKNNKLVIKDGASLSKFSVEFHCDNGYCEIGSHKNVKTKFKANIKIGFNSSVIVGDDVTATSPVYISAVEGAAVKIGNDCMLSSGNFIRTDDAHPIFDVHTGKRLNVSKDVVLHDHVWLAANAVVFGGGIVGEGTVIGRGAFVKNQIPNNCIAVGVPARVSKKDIAWERPHLSLSKPWVKKDENDVKKSKYWNVTK